MRCLKAKADWLGNDPDLILLLDEHPSLSEMRFRSIEYGGATMWYAERDGYVMFFAEAPYDQNGSGGHTFCIVREDGTEYNLVGPWSSNAKEMEDVGFPPSVHIYKTTDPKDFERGWTTCDAKVTLEFAQKAVERLLPGVELKRDTHGLYRPSVRE